jgi:hypothetical protein
MQAILISKRLFLFTSPLLEKCMVQKTTTITWIPPLNPFTSFLPYFEIRNLFFIRNVIMVTLFSYGFFIDLHIDNISMDGELFVLNVSLVSWMCNLILVMSV